MNAAQKLQRLRESGFAIHVSHLRRVYWVDRLTGERDYHHELLTAHEARKRGGEVDGCGGLTRVFVSSPDGRALSAGEAACSLLDVFSRKRGLEIAVGRALKYGSEYVRAVLVD